ncbi:MAG TPA: hypothetical protein VNJ08_16580 [Bacteriovoracaceae bacterium]|nr:hypothetical protein [Bacteriovoracaceae bacterium]
MFKKLITLIMVFTITTVSAQASTQAGLKAAFDELNYSLTVEWDQKDQTVYQAQMKGFQATLNTLKAEGLTNAQLIAFVKTEVKNEKVARDLETAFNMIQINKMSTTEASNYMVETMQKSYNTGASWSGAGSVVVGVVVIAIIVGVLVASGAASAIANTECGYSNYHCGTSCDGLNCDANYCCY